MEIPAWTGAGISPASGAKIPLSLILMNPQKDNFHH
jgi:hypothetical protein